MPLSEASRAPVATRYGSARFDDIFEEDELDRITDYFYRPDPHLDMLIDRTGLPTQTELRKRYAAMCWSGSPNQKASVFAIRIEGALAGFTNLLRQTPDINYSHWHILEPVHRAGGLSSALYPRRLQLYFDTFPIERLIHQTRTSNVGVNRMLDRFIPVSRTEHVEKPDGLARPGVFHMRDVWRADVPAIIARAG